MNIWEKFKMGHVKIFYAVFFFHSCIKKKKTVGNAKRTLKMSDLTQIRLQPQHQNVLLLINSRVILHFFPSMKYFQCEQFATPFKPTNVMLSYFERVLGKPLLLLLHLHIAATKMSHRNLFLNNSASTHSHVEFSTWTFSCIVHAHAGTFPRTGPVSDGEEIMWCSIRDREHSRLEPTFSSSVRAL